MRKILAFFFLLSIGAVTMVRQMPGIWSAELTGAHALDHFTGTINNDIWIPMETYGLNKAVLLNEIYSTHICATIWMENRPQAMVRCYWTNE